MSNREVGRLALRVEGEFWNAYYAPVGTMEGAVLLGSIRLALVAEDGEAKALFLKTMTLILARSVRKATGLSPTWKTTAAPESERSGNA